MNSEILEIAYRLEEQVQELFFLLGSRKRNLEVEVEEIERELESETKKQKRDAFFFSPPSDEIFSFNSSFDSSSSQSEEESDFIDIGEFETPVFESLNDDDIFTSESSQFEEEEVIEKFETPVFGSSSGAFSCPSYHSKSQSTGFSWSYPSYQSSSQPSHRTSGWPEYVAVAENLDMDSLPVVKFINRFIYKGDYAMMRNRLSVWVVGHFRDSERFYDSVYIRGHYRKLPKQ